MVLDSRKDILRDLVLDVKDLTISYETRRMDVRAVRGVTFEVRKNESVGIVGESGCGKSTIALGIVGSLGENGRFDAGSIRFDGEELLGLSQRELRDVRGNKISMVFQDPTLTLNPSLLLGRQLTEVLTYHRDISEEEAWERAVTMLDRVRMPDPDKVMKSYTHQISVGQQQRVVIAMALLNDPSLLILDEPTTALDVTVEAQVLDLVETLKSDLNAGIIFISHNLGVVSGICDYLIVMYSGVIVEKGLVGEIFEDPIHPYTRGLLNCVPKLGSTKETLRFTPIRGRVPEPGEVPEVSCVFEPRCDYAIEECKTADPRLVEGKGGHAVRCILADKIRRDKGYVISSGRKRGKNGDPKDIKRESFLEVERLKVYYPYKANSNLFGFGEKKSVKAVDDVSLKVGEGLTVGIVGESGCGKSTLARGIIGLEEINGGGGDFVGFDLSAPLADRDMEFIRKMQMVFQNPDSTLNPSYHVGVQIARPIKKFKTVPRDKIKEDVIKLLGAVRLGEDFYTRFPRQLSGGEKQRVGVARALASRPDLVILDEPLSSLDVSVQASVINLLLEIQEERGTTMIFIAHDLSVVRFLSDDVVVMYLGKIVERGPAKSIYAPPYHPYTEALLSAVPVIDTKIRKKRIRLSGEIPSAIDPPKGCRFHTRCHRRNVLDGGGKICEVEEPPWQKSGGGSWILCHIPLEELSKIEPIVSEASTE